jgi:hypothetical protein
MQVFFERGGLLVGTPREDGDDLKLEGATSLSLRAAGVEARDSVSGKVPFSESSPTLMSLCPLDLRCIPYTGATSDRICAIVASSRVISSSWYKMMDWLDCNWPTNLFNIT